MCDMFTNSATRMTRPIISRSRMTCRRRYTSGLKDLQSVITDQLNQIQDAGTWKMERVITSKMGPEINVANGERPVLNFCANNYLGLSSHPELIEAGIQALKSHGAGLSSVRFICGTMNIHKSLEEKIARFHGRDDTILYASCFDANAGLFEILLNEEDAIISDELNHASIIDGIRLCKAKRFRYKNGNMTDLEEILKTTQNYRLRMIASDGVFSMDGKVAPLKEICDLAEKYKAFVFLDECHATGILGKTGRGTEEYSQVDSSKVHIINSTLGKALGGAAGGYTTGPQWLIDILRQRSRPYLFSNSIPPSVVAIASKAFDLIMTSSNLPEKLSQHTKYFREKMTAAGFTFASNDLHPISPIMLGDARLAAQFADKMLEHGIYVIGFSYPVVPAGKARIRVQLSASHDREQIDRAIEAFVSVGKELKVI